MVLRRNLSRLDQILRIGVGLVLIYLGFVNTTLIGDTYLAVATGVFGAINVIVGLGGWGAVYLMEIFRDRSNNR